MILVAIILPWLAFFLRGQIIQGIICLALQITMIGWLPAAIWSVMALNSAQADKRAEKMVQKIQKAQNQS